EPDGMGLDLPPQRPAVGHRGEEFTFDALGGFEHAAIVEVDAVAADVLDRKPVAGLEVAPRSARALAKERVVLVESLDECNGDRVRRVGGRSGPRNERRDGGGRHRRCGRFEHRSRDYFGGASTKSLKSLVPLLYSSTAVLAALMCGAAAACCSVTKAFRHSR